MKNLLIAQSGGPTAAINATVAGAVSAAQLNAEIGTIYGAVNGIKGVLAERLVDIGSQLASTGDLDLLASTPSAALGSCRLKLKSVEDNIESYNKIVEVLKKYDIGVFIYVGGNDSMDTVLKLSQYLAQQGIDDIKVMGAPKTIDNDLCEVDHTPGFGSAAKYIATTFSELACDCSVYDIPAVTIVEVMGRDAGWLTASSALARLSGCRAPHLIYLPERAFDIVQFVEDVQDCLNKDDAVIVAVSEGLKDAQGNYVADSALSGAVDAFGHKYLSGTSRFLESVIRDRIGCKVRSIELNLMQRAASHIASATDISESRLLGQMAVNRALAGESGRMATLLRRSSRPYRVEYGTADIRLIANQVKEVPAQWINGRGNDVTQDMIEYLLPLIQGEVQVPFEQGVPKYIRLY